MKTYCHGQLQCFQDNLDECAVAKNIQLPTLVDDVTRWFRPMLLRHVALRGLHPLQLRRDMQEGGKNSDEEMDSRDDSPQMIKGKSHSEDGQT